MMIDLKEGDTLRIGSFVEVTYVGPKGRKARMSLDLKGITVSRVRDSVDESMKTADNSGNQDNS